MRPGLETLRNLGLFASFDDEQLDKLNDLADLARVGPDELLFREGDAPDGLNILLTGYVTMSRAHGEGGEALTDVVGPVRPRSCSACRQRSVRKQ
jgi:CRP-like cAMP-binding protein